eukprot:2934026-Amphidinium_carterae.1
MLAFDLFKLGTRLTSPQERYMSEWLELPHVDSESIRTFLVSYPVLDQLSTHNTGTLHHLHVPTLPAPRRKREVVANIQEDLSAGWAHLFMGAVGPSSAYMVVCIVTL